MIRAYDILISSTAIVLLSPLLILIFCICLIDSRSPLFIQVRAGKDFRPFKLLKLRTMKVGTRSVASHLSSPNSITKLGHLLRRTKLDELPQLINVLKGDMSLVGPRPNLFNQEELIAERKRLGVYDVRPGITGKAQIMNIDMSTPALLAKLDKEMIDELSITSYFKYIFLTALGKGSGDAVKQKDS